ncbi:plastocyanin/azurin family copper-binding protein [Amycolatopsis thermalba]|uniref:Plastocyanin/azurin family copper-binding protein n=1 Tax=Amycolatopsis thermalba TaxID=944492 RepID=A0ABY4NUG0_9PSEU|nr:MULTISPECIES: plastocyanin/azurin family copper-binding protein [Amycolatopsis]UQS23690.1 plastocyanin/azurin family copper-binding protein [Amycolatopsis thermalba]
MRTVLIAVVPVVILALSGCGGGSESPAPPASPAAPGQAEPAPGSTVMTKLLKFDPEKLTVKAGTTVVWKVSDQLGHTVTTGTFSVGGNNLRTSENPDGLIDMPLTKDEEVSFTFGKPGTYTYYCSIHKGMNGEVTVTP